MIVKELIERLKCYDENCEVVFEMNEEFEPESVTIIKNGGCVVRVNSRLKPFFYSDYRDKFLVNMVPILK